MVDRKENQMKNLPQPEQKRFGTKGQQKTFSSSSKIPHHLRTNAGLYRITLFGYKNKQRFSSLLSLPEVTTLFFYLGSENLNNQKTDVRTFDGDWDSMVSQASILHSSDEEENLITSWTSSATILCLENYHKWDKSADETFNLIEGLHNNIQVDSFFNGKTNNSPFLFVLWIKATPLQSFYLPTQKIFVSYEWNLDFYGNEDYKYIWKGVKWNGIYPLGLNRIDLTAIDKEGTEYIATPFFIQVVKPPEEEELNDRT